MFKMLLFATLAAVGNAIFVYGQRGAGQSANPFLFTFGAVIVCVVFFVAANLIYKSPGDMNYVSANAVNMVIAGFGFFLTFIGFFLLFNNYGATAYALYAVLSILTTSVGVGIWIYREPMNVYHVAAIGLSILAIVVFTYGQSKV